MAELTALLATLQADPAWYTCTRLILADYLADVADPREHQVRALTPVWACDITPVGIWPEDADHARLSGFFLYGEQNAVSLALEVDNSAERWRRFGKWHMAPREIVTFPFWNSERKPTLSLSDRCRIRLDQEPKQRLTVTSGWSFDSADIQTSYIQNYIDPTVCLEECRQQLLALFPECHVEG
jgi:hypothetical protein